jgi:hypothetical protein
VKTQDQIQAEKTLRAKIRKEKGVVSSLSTPRECFGCHKTYMATGPRQRFCSVACRTKFLYPNEVVIPDFPETQKNMKKFVVSFNIEDNTLKDFASYLHYNGWDPQEFVEKQICLKALEWRQSAKKDIVEKQCKEML